MDQVQHTQMYLHMQTNQDDIKDTYDKWKELVEKNHIPFRIRLSFDSWFERCFKSSKSIPSSEEVQATAQTAEEKLHDMFVQEVKKKIAQLRLEENKFEWMDFDSDLNDIKDKFTETEWVKLAVECVTDENRSLDAIKMEDTHGDDELIRKIDEVEKLLQDTDKVLQDYRLTQDQVEAHVKEAEEINSQHAGLETLTEIKLRKNGNTATRLSMLKSQFESNLETINKKKAFVQKCVQYLFQTCQTIYDNTKQLVEKLIEDVAEWQDQFKLEYAQLQATADLQKVAPSCGRVGRAIETFLTQFVILRDLLHRTNPDWVTIMEPLQLEVIEMQHLFFHRTFVVTEQSDKSKTDQNTTNYVVKVDRKHLPTVTVRILAADLMETRLDKMKLSAHFIEEEEINECWTDEGFDISKVEMKEKRLKANEVHFSKDKKKCEAVFKGLTFAQSFERAQNTNKLVHEEKYRFVIITQIDQALYSTLSLPMVVTTGANQVCCALASVMWQCFSTNVFQIPIEKTKTQLPWSEVAKMLNAKISKLCKTRPLTEENLTHLRTRLCFDDVDASDETEVTLKQFCFDKMVRRDSESKRDSDDSSFSFWKWFLSCYNLIDQYLNDYWRDNLITGFLSKLEAERLLLATRYGKMGTFLLRFSDSTITNSQGVSTMFGVVTASVLQVSVDGNKKVSHIPVAKHVNLKDKNLANIVEGTRNKNNHNLLRFLYPDMKKREELFDKHCKKGTIFDGYAFIIDAFIVDLDQALSSIEVPAAKLRSPSLDSGCDAASPASLHGIKRRREDTDTPTLRAMLSQQPSRGYMKYSPQHQMDSLSSPMNSPAYSSYSIPSPDPAYQAARQNMPVSSEMDQLMQVSNVPSQSPLAGEQACRNVMSSCLTTTAMPCHSTVSGFADQSGVGMSGIPTVVGEAHSCFQADSPATMSTHQTSIPSPSNEVVIQQPMFTVPSASACNTMSNQEPAVIQYPPNIPFSSGVPMAQSPTPEGVSQLENGLKQALMGQENRDTAWIIYQFLQEMFRPKDACAPFSPQSPQSLHGQMQTDNIPDDIVTSTGNISIGGGMSFDDIAFDEAQEIDSGSLDTRVFDQFGDDQGILG